MDWQLSDIGKTNNILPSILSVHCKYLEIPLG